MPVTAATFERLALEDPDGRWELHRGRPREKPATTFRHNHAVTMFASQVYRQIDVDRFFVHTGVGYLAASETYYIPDFFIVPHDRPIPTDERDETLEVYHGPVLLVVEVSAPSPEGDDADAKVRTYRARGDLEIWRLQPDQGILTVWRRQADGSYDELICTGGTIQPVAIPGGTIQPVAIPGVTIDLDPIFFPKFAL